MMKRLCAGLFAAALISAQAFAQGPGPGPGPSPPPSPWIVSGPTISYNNGGITMPQSVTGGTKGVGTINVSGGYYVNGSPVAPITAGSDGTLLQGRTSLAPIFTATPTLGVEGSVVGSLSFANATSGTVTVQAVSGALGTVTAQLPANSGVLAETNYAQTWTATQTFQNVLAATTNTYDLGTSASVAAFRTIYAGTSFVGPAGTFTASVAAGGCTIGSNALCATGTVALNGATTITSTGSSALSVGPNGATNPVLRIDGATASAATGVTITGAAAAGRVSVAARSSATDEGINFDAKGAGTIVLGATSTGAITLTRATTISAALTYGGVTLSNSVVGTGSMVLATSPSISGLTVTGSFTATGLVTNAALANPSTTVNGQVCTLGSSCTITATAGTITVGTTLVASGATTRILYDNAGTLGEYTISGSGTVVAMAASPVLTTPTLGVAIGTSLALGGGSIGTDALEITGTSTFNGAVSLVSTSLSLSGNQSAAAWTTSGIRIKNQTGTLTDTSSSGTVAAAYTNVLGGNTIAASSSTTYTVYGSTYMKDPVAGSNVTFTAKYALVVDSLRALGNVVLSGTGNSVGTITSGTWNGGTIAGSFVATAADASGGSPSATFGVVKCDGTTINCASGVITAVGAAATAITVGTTTVGSGTDAYLLYNNAGVLGNRTIASVLTSGTGITVSGTTNATISLSAAWQTAPTISIVTSSSHSGGFGANGSGTYTTPANVRRIQMYLIGGGAGGSGGNVGSGGSSGGAGGDTCWNTSGAACTSPVYKASGGGAPNQFNGGVGCTTFTGGDFTFPGASGMMGGRAANPIGATGGASGLAMGQGGKMPDGGAGANAASAGTGYGGGGGGAASSVDGGGGGGGGCTLYKVLSSPAATYTYAVGAAGSAGSAGTGGGAGGAGTTGAIIAVEYYNFLLKRDMDPANDNTPMFLNEVA